MARGRAGPHVGAERHALALTGLRVWRSPGQFRNLCLEPTGATIAARITQETIVSESLGCRATVGVSGIQACARLPPIRLGGNFRAIDL